MAFDSTVARLTLGWPNRIDQATLTGGSWNASFPLTNLQNAIRSVKARTSAATATDVDATNKVLQSQTLDNASWTKVAATVTANAATAPDGTLTADKVIPDATSTNSHQIGGNSGTLFATTMYVISCYAKPSGYNYIYLSFGATNFGASDVIIFDVSTGVAKYISNSGLGNGAGFSITADANGYYRCAAWKACVTGGTPLAPVIGVSSTYSVVAFSGDTTSGALVWGAQCEVDTLTGYIPTTTVQLSRSGNSGRINIQPDMTRPIAAVALINHNLSSAALWSFRLYSNTAAGAFLYASPLTSVWNASGFVPEGVEWEDDNFWPGNLKTDPTNNFQHTAILFADQAYSNVQSIRIDIIDAANADGYVEMGRVFISTAMQPAINMQYGAQFGVLNSTVVDEALDMSEYFDTRRQRRTAQFQLSELIASEYRSLLGMQRDVGIHKEVLIASTPDMTSANAPYESFVGRLKEVTPLQQPYFARYQGSFNLQEIL